MSDVIQTAQKSTLQNNGSRKTMQQYIKTMEGEIAKALPSVITPERFTRMVLSALSVNPKLAQCTPQSFLGAMMTAAQLGVEPNTALGQAYLIPFRNHGTMEAQFQLGYKGLIDLAYRSGDVSIIQAHVVHENDEFTYELGLDPQLKHVPATKGRGKPVAYYAMFKTKDGGYGFEVMSVDDVTEHARRYSKSFGSSVSPWQTNFDEMAKKTVLKRVLKYAPLKSDFVRGIAQDETIKSTISAEMFTEPDEMIYADFEVDENTGEVITPEG
jgi:recombination protein RecT